MPNKYPFMIWSGLHNLLEVLHRSINMKTLVMGLIVKGVIDEMTRVFLKMRNEIGP